MGIWVTHPGGIGGTGGGGGSFPEGSTSNNFATQVAAMTLVHDIRFGTVATGGTQQIKNLTDLNNFSLWDPVDTADPTKTQADAAMILASSASENTNGNQVIKHIDFLGNNYAGSNAVYVKARSNVKVIDCTGHELNFNFVSVLVPSLA